MNLKELDPLAPEDGAITTPLRQGEGKEDGGSFQFHAGSRERFIANMLAKHPGKEALIKGCIQVFGEKIIGVPFIRKDGKIEYYHIMLEDDDKESDIVDGLRKEGRSFFHDRSSKVIISRLDEAFQSELESFTCSLERNYERTKSAFPSILIPSREYIYSCYSDYLEKRLSGSQAGWVEKLSVPLSAEIIAFSNREKLSLSDVSLIVKFITGGSDVGDASGVVRFFFQHSGYGYSERDISLPDMPTIDEYNNMLTCETSRAVRSAILYYVKDNIGLAKWLSFISRCDLISVLSISVFGDFIKELPHNERIELIRGLLKRSLQTVFDEIEIAPERQTALVDELAGRLAEPEAGQAWVERIGKSREPKVNAAFTPLPKDAPIVPWSDREKDESPVDFIMRVYGDRMGRDSELTRAYIRRVDRPLHSALYRWLAKEGNELPEGFDLPNKQETVDRDLASFDQGNHPEEAREWNRLAQARLRREKKTKATPSL